MNPGEAGQNESSCPEENLRTTRTWPPIFLLFIPERHQEKYTVLPNRQFSVEATGISSNHCLKINFEIVASQNMEHAILNFLVNLSSESVTIIGILYLCPGSLNVQGGRWG